MEQLITNYAFNKTTRTIAFLDYSVIQIGGIKSIVRINDGLNIYQFGNPTRDGTVSGNVLTLTYDTSHMENTDELNIVYTSDEVPATRQNQDELISMIHLLKRMVKIMESQGVVTIQGLQRVNVDNQVSTLVTSYPIGSNTSNIPTANAPVNSSTVYYTPTWAGPVDPRWTNMQNARIAYNTGIRSKLINS